MLNPLDPVGGAFGPIVPPKKAADVHIPLCTSRIVQSATSNIYDLLGDVEGMLEGGVHTDPKTG